jgi:hypothetical protein
MPTLRHHRHRYPVQLPICHPFGWVALPDILVDMYLAGTNAGHLQTNTRSDKLRTIVNVKSAQRSRVRRFLHGPCRALLGVSLGYEVDVIYLERIDSFVD